MNRKSKIASAIKRAINKSTRCYFRGKWLKANIFDRNRIRIRSLIKGPALIVEDTSTTFLPPGYVCNVDDYENLIIEKRI